MVAALAQIIYTIPINLTLVLSTCQKEKRKASFPANLRHPYKNLSINYNKHYVNK
jgi:hypothetical protein